MLLLKLTINPIIASVSLDNNILLTNERSIFKVSIGKVLKYDNDEYKIRRKWLTHWIRQGRSMTELPPIQQAEDAYKENKRWQQ